MSLNEPGRASDAKDRKVALNQKFLLLFAIAWSFVLSPLLCEAGILAHFCDAHAGDHCDHEEDCDDDPCKVPALRPAASTTWIANIAPAALLPLNLLGGRNPFDCPSIGIVAEHRLDSCPNASSPRPLRL